MKTKDNEDTLIKELLANYKGPEDLIGENGPLKRLTKKLVEGALGSRARRQLRSRVPRSRLQPMDALRQRATTITAPCMAISYVAALPSLASGAFRRWFGAIRSFLTA